MGWLINKSLFLRVGTNKIEDIEKMSDSKTLPTPKIDIGVPLEIWIDLT